MADDRNEPYRNGSNPRRDRDFDERDMRGGYSRDDRGDDERSRGRGASGAGRPQNNDDRRDERDYGRGSSSQGPFGAENEYDRQSRSRSNQSGNDDLSRYDQNRYDNLDRGRNNSNARAMDQGAGGRSDSRGQNDQSSDQNRQSNFRSGFTGQGPKGYVRSDDRIREEASDRLMQDDAVDAKDIEITVKNGELTLSGTVDHRADKRRAEDCVENIGGVKHVQNNLRVGEAEKPSTATKAKRTTQ